MFIIVVINVNNNSTHNVVYQVSTSYNDSAAYVCHTHQNPVLFILSFRDIILLLCNYKLTIAYSVYNYV